MKYHLHIGINLAPSHTKKNNFQASCWFNFLTNFILLVNSEGNNSNNPTPNLLALISLIFISVWVWKNYLYATIAGSFLWTIFVWSPEWTLIKHIRNHKNSNHRCLICFVLFLLFFFYSGFFSLFTVDPIIQHFLCNYYKIWLYERPCSYF